MPLKHLGEIKKGHLRNKSSLFVEAVFEGDVESRWVPAQLMPFLVKGRAYGKSDKQKKSVAKQFKGRQTKSLQTSYIGDIQHIEPFMMGSERIPYFRLITSDAEYCISSHELARSLFFHDHNLVDAAFRPNGLLGLASCNIGSEEVEIKFPKGTDYPASNLNSNQTKQHLIKLFLNESYRKSFASIFEKRSSSNNINRFVFDFVPPNLEGLYFEVLCNKGKDDTFLVYEVKGIQDHSFFYSGVVYFLHPRKKMIIKKDSTGVGWTDGTSINRPDPSEKIDLNENPGFGKNKKTVSESGFTYRLLNNVKAFVDTSEIQERSYKKSPPKKKSGEDEVPMSAGVAIDGGKADFVEPRLNTDESVLDSSLDENVLDRFSLFTATLDKVVGDLKCDKHKIHYASLPKPSPEFNNKQWISKLTCKPRLVCVVEFCFRDTFFVALDVDIAGMGKTSMSSRLVVFNESEEDALVKPLDIVLEGLSNSKNINWPSNEVFEGICHFDSRVIHLSKKRCKELEDLEKRKESYISDWSGRWKNEIQSYFD